MDSTRVADLEHLHKVMNDPEESELHHRQAFLASERIKRKMRDPFIKSQRERLVRATIAGDIDESEKISLILQNYEKRNYPDRVLH